jgi:hypothetical protein
MTRLAQWEAHGFLSQDHNVDRCQPFIACPQALICSRDDRIYR